MRTSVLPLSRVDAGFGFAAAAANSMRDAGGLEGHA